MQFNLYNIVRYSTKHNILKLLNFRFMVNMVIYQVHNKDIVICSVLFIYLTNE